MESSVSSYPTRQLSPSTAPLRALFVAVALLVLPAACTDPDALPTGPTIARATMPQTTIVGADVMLLPTLGGTWVEAADINDAGQVVGTSFLPGDSISHAFLWTPGYGMLDLGTLGGKRSSAAAINELGQIVGSSIAASGREHPFLWTPERGMQDLVGFGGSLALFNGAADINDVGQVVGYTAYGDPTVYASRAFLWTEAGGIQDIGSLGGVMTRPRAINNVGQVVGESQTRRTYHGFLWTAAGGMQDLGTLPGPDGIGSVATDINEGGQIVGSATADMPPANPLHAVLWTPGAGMQDLGLLAGALSNSSANGINDLGQVVGGATSGGPTFGPFVWTSANGMELLSPTQGYGALARINNHGQAVGGNRVMTLRFAPPNRDPDGAFATGSGFYTISGQRRSKAHFTFSAKFLPGASVPNGSARLWIPGDRFEFESTTIAMLVVSGNRAQFWGTGTLNGAAVRFRITAVDGGAPASGAPDAFRIELWNAAGTTLLFDTQPGTSQDAVVTTAIEAGNIQIHRD